MPELPEVESYRSLAASAALGREITGVSAPDSWYLKGGADAAILRARLIGGRFTGARRRGKLLLLDHRGTGPGRDSVLGLRFGMTGRLVVDGVAAVDGLLYSASTNQARHDRFAVGFAGGGSMVVHDPRRLGGVELDPDESRLGPDALTLTPSQLGAALAGSAAPLKACLLDQGRLAGVGNLIADEVLWRAGLSPQRAGRSLEPFEIRRLHRHLRRSLDELMRRGGSHTGDLQEHRLPGGLCPRDGSPLARATVGGRTTWWCPAHQR